MPGVEGLLGHGPNHRRTLCSDDSASVERNGGSFRVAFVYLACDGVGECLPSSVLKVGCGAPQVALNPTELAHAVGIFLAAGHGQRREQV